ncbi:MAG: hypothetical protein QM485_05450 [Flavobacteriaceae bacterium]
MTLYLDSFKNNPPNGVSTEFHVQGLDDFINILEKYFFSKVTVRKGASKDSEINLIVDLSCDLTLAELLHHFNKDIWGGFEHGESSLSTALHNLRNKNEKYIEIEEFSIFLKDSSIITNCIYKNSILDQLKAILIKIGNHYIHFTKGLSEIPYEIYIPVFEEGISENESNIMDIEVRNKEPKDYYNFWGLYYNSEDDAVIYDLENMSTVHGDLYMLNH